MIELFKVDVSTKMHSLMRYVHHHLGQLGCISRGSSEDKKILHKDFKILHNSTNKHLNCIAPQLLTSWIDLLLDQPR